MAITTEAIKELRDATGVSIMQCKKALEEAGGDMEKAKVILQKYSKQAADKKADRELGAGTVASYIHQGGNVGVIVELMCETDYVSKNENFQTLARDIAMHIAALAPQFLKKSDIREEDMAAAKEVFAEETEGKPEELKEKILAGKLDAYLADKTLLDQPFIKDPSKTIQVMLDEAIQKLGEKVEITRFTRYSIN
jgi:elongation factor Ts